MSEPNQLLAQLAQHPGWTELGKTLEERMDKEFHRLAVDFATKDKRPDYEDLQWVRGFLAGMKFLYRTPTLEASALAKQLARERGDE